MLYRVEVAVKPQGGKQSVKVFSDYLFVSPGARSSSSTSSLRRAPEASCRRSENRIAKLLASRAP